MIAQSLELGWIFTVLNWLIKSLRSILADGNLDNHAFNGTEITEVKSRLAAKDEELLQTVAEFVSMKG